MVFGRGFRVSVGIGARRLRHCASAGWVSVEGVCASIGPLGGIRLCGGFRRIRMAMKILWEAGGESCGT